MSQQDPRKASAVDENGLRIWSCVICRRRKVRCDRREPCDNCIRSNVECHYPVTGRLPRRRNLVTGVTPQAQKQSELINRLRRLESIVTELSAQVEEGAQEQGITGGLPLQIPLPLAPEAANSVSRTLSRAGLSNAAAPVPTPSSTTSSGNSHVSLQSNEATTHDSEQDEDFGKLVVARDGALHVGNQFWTVFCSEVDQIFRAVEDVVELSDEANMSTTQGSTSTGNEVASISDGFFFGHMSHSNALIWHTLPQSFLWTTFVVNVDPFIKVLHTPTIDKMILNQQAATLDPELRTLLTSIAFAAVASLGEEDVITNLCMPKQHALAGLRQAVEGLLSQCKVLSTNSVIVVQAFVIYLSVLALIERPNVIWPLVGLLTRIATSMGLHRDGSLSNLSPFDAEMRRRLWWQIYLLESRSSDDRLAQLCITEELFDTNVPANASDSAIGPESSSAHLHLQTTGITSATLFIIRCLFRRLAQQVATGKQKTVNHQLGLVDFTRQTISNTYLSQVNTEKDIQVYIEAMTSLAFAKIEFIIYVKAMRQARDSRRDVHAEPQYLQALVTNSLKIVDTTHPLLTEEKWRRWRWQLSGGLPTHALSVALRYVCRVPWDETSDRVLAAASNLINMPAMLDLASPATNLLGTLLSKARRHKESESVLSCFSSDRIFNAPVPTPEQFSTLELQDWWIDEAVAQDDFLSQFLQL
ncbi:fungal-specific transcription factor domain-containing protein [Stachybotrys elegans]|uniref:Fungal-specific transcription factor domain-containing protein n=1 Tax=Stachybotrys elegans TaxID=80388 RepID=A0A8K0SPD4_9HYPO|nr:fungal-specific transcription factor domain-containing protein [Stachybotrys elegans]